MIIKDCEVTGGLQSCAQPGKISFRVQQRSLVRYRAAFTIHTARNITKYSSQYNVLLSARKDITCLLNLRVLTISTGWTGVHFAQL